MFERFYRFLLRLLPREFRERFADEMLDTARRSMPIGAGARGRPCAPSPTRS